MLFRAVALCSGLLAVATAWAQTTAPAPEPTAPPAVTPSTPPPAAPPAPSAPALPEHEDARYTFHRVQDGYLRLDVRTGRVAQCSRRQVGWACQAVPDERAALEGEIARLQKENGALKTELLSRGMALPSGVKPPPPKAEEERKPSDSGVDRAMTMVESLWRRLVEMIGNLQRDIMNRT